MSRMSSSNQSILETVKFCEEVPKVELHAHLNGSISSETIQALSARKTDSKVKDDNLQKLEKWKAGALQREQRSIEDCFGIFPLIVSLVDDAEAVAMATRDVIHEFAADNVKYLEIRSSPKEVLKTGMTRQLYIETVLNEIRKCNSEDLGIITRFILSIDRNVSIPVMGEVVRLAEYYKLSSDGLLLGLDLSGNPFTTNVKEVLPLLSKARNSGLKLALHLAEIEDRSEESLMLLQVPPDRIGHGTFMHPSAGGNKEMEELVTRLKIPVECCLTSNLIGRTVKSYSDHHFKYWLDKNHPVVLCTDDKGVFSTTLSEEYKIAAETFNLSRDEIWRLTTDSIDCIFADDSTKSQLKTVWQSWKRECWI